MKFFITGLTFVLATLTTTINGHGINCKGSGECHFGGWNNAPILVQLITNIDPHRWYNDRELIVCTGFFCAFLQNTGGAWGYNIQGLAPYITDHGCSDCGSVPYFYPTDNDVSNGELTFNAVTWPCTQLGTNNVICA